MFKWIKRLFFRREYVAPGGIKCSQEVDEIFKDLLREMEKRAFDDLGLLEMLQEKQKLDKENNTCQTGRIETMFAEDAMKKRTRRISHSPGLPLRPSRQRQQASSSSRKTGKKEKASASEPSSRTVSRAPSGRRAHSQATKKRTTRVTR